MTVFWLATDFSLVVYTSDPSTAGVWQVGISLGISDSLPSLRGSGWATSAKQIRQLATIDSPGW